MDVLYQDDALLVVNKPSGLATLPDGYDPTLPHVKGELEHYYGPLWIVHRLDKDTSGVLVLARSTSAHRVLNSQFEGRSVSKVYHAVVSGNPDWKAKTVNLPLNPDGDRQHRTVVDQYSGKPSVTHFKVLERFGHFSLLQAIPETGRTHQIRAHLYTLGLFILGDKLYTKKGDLHAIEDPQQADPWREAGIPMGLHARSLEFSHPMTEERLKFTAPYPIELSAVLERLRLTSKIG